MRKQLETPNTDMDFDDFKAIHSDTAKTRYGATRKEHRDLFTVQEEYSLPHCATGDIRMSRGISRTFRNVFGQMVELERQNG